MSLLVFIRLENDILYRYSFCVNYYAPLNVLKPVGKDIWIVDGPEIKFFGMPFTTRMTVIRLKNGDIFIHSPIKPELELVEALKALGPIKHLVSPNWIHYAFIAEWANACPSAIKWASPNVKERANKKSMHISFDHDLETYAPDDWKSEIHQMIVEGSSIHREVVFFHLSSKTLILTDLIENFEAEALPWPLRILVRMIGIVDPDGKMPLDMWLTFRKRRNELRGFVERMIAWEPKYIVLAHGRCYDHDCTHELRRAFRKTF